MNQKKKQTTTETPRKSLAVLLRYLILFVLVCLVHANGIQGVFILDDFGSIHNNTSIRHLASSAIDFVRPVSGETASGRPLLNLSLGMNYAISELQPWSYHLLNILIHACNALLLMSTIELVLKRLVGEPVMRENAVAIAFWTAALWGVHPLTTQCVVYIVQRAESLAVFFYIVAFLAFIRSALAERDRWWSLLAVVSCWMGMATKEIVVTLPFLLLVFDSLFIAKSWLDPLRKRLILHLGMFCGIGVLAALMFYSGDRGGSIGSVEGITAFDYLTTQVWAIGRYLQLVVWPFPQIFDYGYITVSASEWFPQAIPLLIEVVLFVVLVFRFPKAAFTGLAFFCILAPTSSIVPINTQTVSEHRMYLPLAAILLQIVLIVFWFGSSLAGPIGSRARVKSLGWSAGFVLIVLLGLTTFNRNRLYQSGFDVWQSVVRDRPNNSRGYYSLGFEHRRVGNLNDALKNLDRALEIEPTSMQYLAIRGLVRFDTGDVAGAIEDYSRAIEQAGGESAAAYERRGFFRFSLKEFSAAEKDFLAALELQPDNVDALVNHGRNLEAQGKLDLALESYSKALKSRATADMLYHRGNLQLRRGELQFAFDDFNWAIELEPDNSIGYLGRSYAFFNANMLDQARTDAEQAIRLGLRPDPEYLKSLVPEPKK